MSNVEVAGIVSGLFIYPIKGCKAMRLESATATPRGFPYDRHWVIVKDATYRYITQRNYPRLAKIAPEVPLDVMDGTGPMEDRYLTIRVPSADGAAQEIQIPLMRSDPVYKQITVCEWTGAAIDEGDEAAEGLSVFLEMSVRLFRFISDEETRSRLPKDKVTRPVDGRFVYGYDTTFTDGFPYLIVNEKSHQNLRDEVQRVYAESDGLLMDRFRPNIVVKARRAWEEDDWREIRMLSGSTDDDRVAYVSGPTFRLVKPCQRCTVTCIDQTTAIPGIEPLATLRRIRSGRATGYAEHLKSSSKEGFFGWNAVCREIAHVAVGDAVCAQKSGPWVPGLSWLEYAQATVGWLRGMAGI